MLIYIQKIPYFCFVLVKTYNNVPTEKDLQSIVSCLESGGVLILPTDTIYSMVCKLGSKKGFEALCRIKGVQVKNADFSLLCPSLSVLSHYTKPINTPTFRMLNKNLPGPFTFVLEANGRVPKLFANKRKTIGIRVPDNITFQSIAERMSEPLVGTSIHDEDAIVEYTTDPELIDEKFSGKVEMVVNGGIGGNVASTVVDCTSQTPLIVRQGKGDLII